MSIKKMLAVLLCLSMILCGTLPILANNHKALNSKITLLSRASGGGGGGGGGSSSGGGGGGGGGSSSGSSSGGGGGSSYSSGGASGGGSSSSSSSGSSSSSSGSSGGGSSYSSGSASGGGGSSYISGGASGGGGGDDASTSSGSPLYYDPSAWDSVSDFQEYRDSIINPSNNSSGSGSGGSSYSTGGASGGGGSSYISGGASGGGGSESGDSGSHHSIYDSNGNLIATYDLSAEGSWVSGDGTYGGGAIQTYQGNTSSSGNRSASGGGSAGGTWVQNPNTNKWYFYESANSPSESKRSTGWKEISGSWYYFGQDGAMYQNQITPDGYYVDNNGAWVKQ